jgi:hypothetical protein
MDTGHSRRLGHTRGKLKLVIDSRVRPMSESGHSRRSDRRPVTSGLHANSGHSTYGAAESSQTYWNTQ